MRNFCCDMGLMHVYKTQREIIADLVELNIGEL